MKEEEEEEEEDGGEVSFNQLLSPTHSQVRDLSSAQSEVCNICQHILNSLLLHDVNILTFQLLSSPLSPVSPSSSPSSYLATLPRVTRRLFRWGGHCILLERMFCCDCELSRGLCCGFSTKFKTSLSADSDPRQIYLELCPPQG